MFGRGRFPGTEICNSLSPRTDQQLIWVTNYSAVDRTAWYSPLQTLPRLQPPPFSTHSSPLQSFPLATVSVPYVAPVDTAGTTSAPLLGVHARTISGGSPLKLDERNGGVERRECGAMWRNSTSGHARFQMGARSGKQAREGAREELCVRLWARSANSHSSELQLFPAPMGEWVLLLLLY